MSRFLLLLRHGKSDWSAPFGHDHERPLAARGRRAARRVGRFLTAAGWPPDRILTSPAVRARTTVELAAEAGGWSCPRRSAQALYDGGVAGVLDEVGAEASEAERLLLAGHQPTWSELVSRLAGGAEVRLPTAAVACLRFETESWAAVGDRSGELVWLVTPKLLEPLEI